ncbi:MAG: uroporphyrinogen decarboxylase family protein [Burkholderiaceae bacterium]
MNKKERFLAAVHGREVDRPPVTSWVHFLSDHLDSERTADLHHQFMLAYDWDVLKVMNDYRYPVPEGVSTLASPESLAAYRKLGLDHPAFAVQLDVLTRLRKQLGADTPMLETVFEPYQQIVRNVGFSEAENFFNHGQAALDAIEEVTETTCDYIRKVKALGVDGIFLSINGAIPVGRSRGVSPERHETFQKPFAIRVLEAAEGMVRVLHVHGDHLQMDRVWDYPCEVLSVSDRLAGNPSLSDLRNQTDKCLMGGLDETRIQERSLPEIAAEIDDAIQQVGRQKLILGPGCTIPSFTSQRNLEYLRSYTRAL